MLDLVKDETERIDSRFLEPACGDGNFLVPVLRRKLAAVELKYGPSDFERRHFALFALMCVYGIELLPDNIKECHANLLRVFVDYLQLDPSDDFYRAAVCVLSVNLIHGNARTMLTWDHSPIIFAEWAYLWKGRFKRRDFSLKSLTQMSSLRKVDPAADSEGRNQSELFAEIAGHAVFQPIRDYPAMTVAELAAIVEQPTL